MVVCKGKILVVFNKAVFYGQRYIMNNTNKTFFFDC